MSPAVLFRTFCFLLILFVVVYIGTENTQSVDFRFSLLLDKPVRMPGALIYFSMFAVGVVGGTLFGAGSGKSSAKGGDDSAKKKKK